MQQERKAKNAFTKRKELLTKAFSLCLKKRITDYHLEYSSVWCRIVDLLKKEDVRRLESCEMWLWRKVLSGLTKSVTKKYWGVWTVGEERAIISVINRRQGVWLGHTLRYGDHVPLVIEGRIIGKRSPGTPLAGMLDRVKDGSPYVAVKRRALDRELWGKTCLWAENTHTHTCSVALPLKFGSPRDNTLSDLRVLLPVSLFIMDERTSEKPEKNNSGKWGWNLATALLWK